jgi:hypothetical protein
MGRKIGSIVRQYQLQTTFDILTAVIYSSGKKALKNFSDHGKMQKGNEGLSKNGNSQI